MTLHTFARIPILFAGFLICTVGVTFCQDSGFNIAVHANSRATAADIGLPSYPGATLSKDPDNDSAVDMGFTFGDVHFKIMAANYATPASPSQIFEFYRKPLSRYGEVLECDHGKPVGALTVTRSGLTCSDEKGDHIEANGSANSSSDHELRAGAPHQFRLVGIKDAHPGSTRFGLVYLELPKDKKSSGETN